MAIRLKAWIVVLLTLVLTLTLSGWIAQTSPGQAAFSGEEFDRHIYLPLVMRQNQPTPTPTPIPPTPTPTPPPGQEWLDRVNALRAMADLPPVTENTDWTQGCIYHSRYIVKNDELTHYEDPNNPWYTQEGYDAGHNGNVMCSSDINTPDVDAINMWMVGPFHGLGIIDPRLERAAFGSYREDIGFWTMAATLDVLRGLNWSVSVTYPVFWPGNGKTVDMTRFPGGESPNPLSSCPGYTPPTGIPIIIQLGKGSVTPNITAHSLKQGTTDLDHCIFDETTYTNPDSDSQALGRNVLNMRDAVVIMPRQPLVPGKTYTVSITNSGITYTWSFNVATTVQTVLIGDSIRY